MSKKVITAISGGVDSAVALDLLKKEGFEAEAVFFKLWQEKGGCFSCPGEGGCLSLPENRARLVAGTLGVPFSVIDLENEFKKEVIDYFLKEHRQGRTPNPCVACNKEIKFKVLFQELQKRKADYVSTGHYVIKKNNKLFKARDEKKDQSYFLWRLNKDIIGKCLFPNGNFTKEEIRKKAKESGIPVFDAPESQEVCFIEKTTEDFIKRYLKNNPGKIKNKKGNILGYHEGLWFYTIGQRKRIGLSGGPFYVIKKDLKNNVLIVSKDKKDLLSKKIKTKDMNWISGKPGFPLKVKAKIRYGQEGSEAEVFERGIMKFKKPQEAATPGQSAVFYRKEELLGGGIIDRSYRA